ALGRVTKSKENPNTTAENMPAYAQGLDDVVIVKVICGSNIMLALSDKGQLYAIGIFRVYRYFSKLCKINILTIIIPFTLNDNNRNTGFTSTINKQSIFVKYEPTFYLKIANIAIRENHVLVLTTNGYLYTFGYMDSCQLRRRISARKPNGGQNMEGQCDVESLNPIITSIRLEFFKNLLLRVNQISAGLYHTLVLLENGYIYSFGSTKDGQLSIGVSEGGRKSPVRINLDNCKYVATGDHHSIAVNKKNEVYKVYTWGFGETSALGNRNENSESLPFELKFEIGEILAIGGGSQFSAILAFS
ncbi:5547_t:CDS:2, partial [Gigaspora rosea]